MNTKTIEGYADEIMVMIREDMDEIPAMRGARNWFDLNDHVDGNEYMLHAEVPFNADDDAVMAVYLGVQDEVARRLEALPEARPVTSTTTAPLAVGSAVEYREDARLHDASPSNPLRRTQFMVVYSDDFQAVIEGTTPLGVTVRLGAPLSALREIQ